MVCSKKIVSPASLLGRLTTHCSSVEQPKAISLLPGSYCAITLWERIFLNPRSSDSRSVFQIRPQVGLNILFKILLFFFSPVKTTVFFDTYSVLAGCSSKTALNRDRNSKNLQFGTLLCHFSKAFLTDQSALQSREAGLSIPNLNHHPLL